MEPESGTGQYKGGVPFGRYGCCAFGAYRNEDNVFFSDFYSDAADYFYEDALSELVGGVEFTRVYDEIMNPLGIPQNYELFITNWVAID